MTSGRVAVKLIAGYVGHSSMAGSCTEIFFTKPCTTGYEEVASSNVVIVTGVGIIVTGAERIATKDWARSQSQSLTVIGPYSQQPYFSDTKM